jgi:hypothetical protein
MSSRRIVCGCLCGCLVILFGRSPLRAQTAQSSSSSSSSKSKPVKKAASGADSPLDSGTVVNGVYHNAALGFTCKIPAGWVLRTEEMNARGEDAAPTETGRAALDRTAESGCPHKGSCGSVLLAAFSRPPEARAEDVNGSIVIAAESAAAIPGLKEAAQYFVLVNEAAKAQGLEMDDEPYDFAVETKTVVRGDFQKDVGSRVMRQSTLVVLAHGYVVSFTFIGGTEDEVEELVQGLSFGTNAKPAK